MFRTLRQPFFNAEGEIGGGQAGGNESASSNSESFPSGWGLPNGGNQAAANPLFNSSPEPVVQQPVQQEEVQGQVFDFAGRKIEVADPSIAAALKDVHKDYTALTGTFTQTSQRVKELEQANQTYLNLLSQGQQSQGQSVQDPQQAEPSEQDFEQMKSDFMEKFYDNPQSALEGMLEQMFQQKIQPVIEPISKEREWNEQVQGLQQKYPDFQGMVGSMQQLIEEMPELAQHGLESVYHFAKRTQPAQAPTPEQLLSDPNFLQELSQNPDVKKQFLSQYLQEKQGLQDQAPTIMGSQPGGQIPTATEDSPKDMRSGSKAFKRYLGL